MNNSNEKKYWVQIQPIYQPTMYKPFWFSSRLKCIRMYEKLAKKWPARELASNCKR